MGLVEAAHPDKVTPSMHDVADVEPESDHAHIEE
jgi:hypothetical protein